LYVCFLFCVFCVFVWFCVSFLPLYIAVSCFWTSLPTAGTGWKQNCSITPSAEINLCIRDQSQSVTVSRSIHVRVNPLRVLITHSYTSSIFCKQETNQYSPKWQLALFFFFTKGLVLRPSCDCENESDKT
jgi:hypothetical protein